MGATQTATSITALTQGEGGYIAVSLTAYDTTSVPSILAGSRLEVAGALFYWGSDETPSSTSWTAIATTTTAYLVCTPSGSAGSQILTSSYVASAPTWSTSKQGWYTAADAARAVASVYKGGATNSQKKMLLAPLSYPVQFGFGGTTPIMQRDTSGAGAVIFPNGIAEQKGAAALKTKVIEIGEWNMDGDVSVTIAHGISSGVTAIKGVQPMIVSDDGLSLYPLVYPSADNSVAGYWAVGAANLVLNRTSGGWFDGTSFNATASTVANRGYAMITYQV